MGYNMKRTLKEKYGTLYLQIFDMKLAAWIQYAVEDDKHHPALKNIKKIKTFQTHTGIVLACLFTKEDNDDIQKESA